MIVTNQYGCTSSHTIEVLPGKGCDGLDPNPPSGDFAIYPNPAELGKEFTIEMNSEMETSTVEIVNITTGKVVYRSELEFGTPLVSTMQISDSENGPSVYYIKIYNDTHVVTKRLVVK